MSPWLIYFFVKFNNIYSDSDNDSDGYCEGEGEGEGEAEAEGDGDSDGDGDRCHVTFEGQPWLHWSVNFEMTMIFCRAALATPILLTTKLLGPGVKPTLFQSRMNLIYYLEI